MIKRAILGLLLCFLSNIYLYSEQVNSLDNTFELSQLYELCSRNFNLSSKISEDSIISSSVSLEAKAVEQKDFDSFFKIGQIRVNAYCLKGDIGVATNEARSLYERAKALNSDVGMSLALQAIGDTYMHSNQPQQAFNTFVEADKYLKIHGSAPLQTRLYLQIIHVCSVLNDMSNMNMYLDKVSYLLQNNQLIGKEHYTYYLLCYESLYHIGMNDAEKASLLLERLNKERHSDALYNRWYYWVMSRYCELQKDYVSALAYVDSTLVEVKLGGNLNEYLKTMIERASFLENTGNVTEACIVYQEVDSLTDLLDIQRYTRQIEHLHTTYLVDQLKHENEEMHSSLYTWIMISCMVILLGGIMLFLLVSRKNKKIIISRNKLQVVREETARSIQAKSMFLSNMSHELRTPLNAIVGFSGILTNCDSIDAETKQQCGDSIQQNADLLMKLVKDVMDFSELNINEIRYSCNTYNVINICRMVVDTVDKVKQTSATVQFQTTIEELSLYTDSGRLQQVLINLLVNATKFTKAGTIILKLTVDEEKKEAVFAVEDTGCGIPLEKQPNIFGRFEKLHEGVQGFGLGLSICQLIVEHFGGRIWIDSSYTVGARFVFTHPLLNSNSQAL